MLDCISRNYLPLRINLEKLKFAIHYGADAVYIGGQKYGLRSSADNFSLEEMREAVEFANGYGAKVFVATNIYAHNEDIEGLDEYLRGFKRLASQPSSRQIHLLWKHAGE